MAPAAESTASPISNDDLCVIKAVLDERREMYHETNPLLNVPDGGIRFELFEQQFSVIEGDASLLDGDLMASIGWLSDPDSLFRVSLQVFHSGYGKLRHAPDVCHIELSHWLDDDPTAFVDDLVEYATEQHQFSLIDAAANDPDTQHHVALQSDDIEMQIDVPAGDHHEVRVTIFTRTPGD